MKLANPAPIPLHKYFTFSIDERYDKSFQISVTIDGISEQHKPLSVLGASMAHNRTRHLVCVRNDCEEFTVMHLGFLDYAHYIITVRFLGLESFHQKYNIRAITFYVSMSVHSLSYTVHIVWIPFAVQDIQPGVHAD